MSKPEIIIQDFGGKLGGDLEGTAARLIQGATWKKQRIVLILPADATIRTKVALSHWNLVFPPNQPVVRVLCQGMEVGDAYSTALEQVIAHPELSQWEYLLTIEHDNMPPPDGVLKLIETMDAHPEFSAVSGLYFCKGYGGCAQIWGDPNDPVCNYRPQVPKPGQVIECCGTGMGFGLWRLSMFKDTRLARPWFKTRTGPGGSGTQDLAFWADARKYGFRCAVDCRVIVGHMDLATGEIW